MVDELICYLVTILFTIVLWRVVSGLRYTEAAVLFLSLIFVFTGELLNLFIYRAAAYSGTEGIPLYILFGGALIAWGLFIVPSKLAPRGIFAQIAIFFSLTVAFPLIETAGVQSGLWYWLKPYNPISIYWIFGVWKFYVIFVGLPPLSVLILRNYLSKR